MESHLIDRESSFAKLGLDPRLIKALQKLGIFSPTVIQSQSLPSSLAKRDVLLCSPTGSGKTLAYILPVMHNILQDAEASMQQNDSDSDDEASEKTAQQGIQALVLVPTKELSKQVGEVARKMAAYCWDRINVLDLSGDYGSAAEVIRLKEYPQIVVSTPAKLVKHCREGNLSTLKDSMKYLVVDEADLILNFGYDEDIKELLTHIPKLHHTLMMSATLSPEIDSLKRLVLNRPVIFKLKKTDGDVGGEEEQEGDDVIENVALPKVATNVEHFYIDLSSGYTWKDLFLYAYTLVKLNVLQGKTIFFVNSIDQGFKFKLFFEAFSISCAVLNNELPVSCRLQTVKQFNNGMIDFLIATDECLSAKQMQAMALVDDSDYQNKEEEDEDEDDEELAPSTKKFKKSGKKGEVKDKEFGVSRGVDFRDVANVVNLDFPNSLKSFVHRAGRTGRGGASGTTLSFLLQPKQRSLLKKVQEYYNVELKAAQGLNATVVPEDTLLDEEENAALRKELKKKLEEEREDAIKPLTVQYKDVAAFKYRVFDVLRGITTRAVQAARMKEIKLEMLRSEKLKSHFVENPNEKSLLQTGNVLRPQMVQPHLKSIPSYLVPKAMEQFAVRPNVPKGEGILPVRKNERKRVIRKSRQQDPLKTFSSIPTADGAIQRKRRRSKKH